MAGQRIPSATELAEAQRTADMKLVVECAFSYAGEIGFSDRAQAMELWNAAKRLRPELEPER